MIFPPNAETNLLPCSYASCAPVKRQASPLALITTLGLKRRVETLCPKRKAHDALYDAVASAMLLEHLVEQPGWGNVTVAELVSM